ncbi:MAG: prolipoprotein diacylglyceryl transferase [Bdellovibrionaceae bacterium]|nr:prolipoprotein diacylglyceryl transferase [Pseudobdellovibrionaceae bacterium]
MAFPFLQDVLHYLFNINVYLPIPTFGTFVAISLLIGFAVFKKELLRKEAEGILPRKNPMSAQTDNFAFLLIISGMIGARLFHILEYFNEFLENPKDLLLSTGGYTIYGAFILGTVAGVYFLKKKNYPVLPVADAAAPTMLLGYSIGRLGCQFSGDGDWGTMANMALKPDGLPKWMWAQQYIHNVIGESIPEPGVYPTPLYEALASFILFLILWKIRKHHHSAGWLFAVYLLFNGLERFFIEKIRVNSNYNLLGLHFTQAELISSVLIIMGITGIFYFWKYHKEKWKPASSVNKSMKSVY